MRSKDELLAALDALEKDIGALLNEVSGDDTESVSIQQSRIRYAEGGLWLRHWIERVPHE